MHRRTWIAAAMLLFVVAACDDKGTTEEDGSIVGSYSVQTFDGHALPYTDEAEGTVLTSGVLQLKSDHTFAVAYVGTRDGVAGTETDSGTYTYTNGDLALLGTGETVATHGTFSGTTLTVHADEGVYVLKKN